LNFLLLHCTDASNKDLNSLMLNLASRYISPGRYKWLYPELDSSDSLGV